MRLFQIPILGKAAPFLAATTILVTLTGCPKNVKQTISAQGGMSVSNGPNGTTTTYSGQLGYAVTFQENGNIGGLTPDDLEGVTPSDIDLVVYAPQRWSYNSAADMATATFKATTDTGYTSTITVNLDQTGPTGTIPFNYTPYPFEVASSSAGSWEAWLSTVASNTNSTSSLSISASVPLMERWTAAGSYSFSAANIDPDGETDFSGSSSISIPAPPPSGCGTPNTKCYQQ
jgi:hypothetical protein